MPKDIKLTWDLELQGAKMSFENNDVVADYSLLTSVIISLFTDAKASIDDELPDPRDLDLRGWWGNSTNPLRPSDQVGSKLWLLERSKATKETLNKAEQYTRDALQWIIDEGIAKRTDIVVENQRSEISGTNILGIHVAIIRPDDITETFKFILEWAASALEGE